MLGFVLGKLIFLLAEGGGRLEWWYENVDPFLNYPGFEFWRFFNLLFFVLVLFYLVRKPMSNAFKARREVIRADLIKAENEKKAAEEKLSGAEALIAGLEEEKTKILQNAKAESEAEKARLKADAEISVRRLAENAENKLFRKTAQANSQLRRFSAEESIRLAEEKVRSSLNAAKDAELVKRNINSIGGLGS